MTRARTVLAVVRCGDASLHETWSIGHPTVDLAVSYFGGDADRQFAGAAFVHRYKGGKWDGIHRFFTEHPEATTAYEYYWFPDDDIRMTPQSLAKLLEVGASMRLELFQPALDENSYYSHIITLRNKSFLLRYTNFVEIMAPVVSRNLLPAALAQMAQTRSGFGLDFVWAREAASISALGARSVAIIDAVTMEHTRPVGGALHSFMKATGGRSARDEFVDAVGDRKNYISSINGVPAPRIRVVGALDAEGKAVGKPLIPILAFLDLVFLDRNRKDPPALKRILKHTMNAIF